MFVTAGRRAGSQWMFARLIPREQRNVAFTIFLETPHVCSVLPGVQTDMGEFSP